MDVIISPNFNKHINDLMEEWHVTGLAIAIVQDQTILSKAFGKASLEPEEAVTADTLFDIASSSKSMTAGAVATARGR